MSGVFGPSEDYVRWRCPLCNRVGYQDEWIRHPRQGHVICPVCWRKGIDVTPDDEPAKENS